MYSKYDFTTFYCTEAMFIGVFRQVCAVIVSDSLLFNHMIDTIFQKDYGGVINQI